MGFKINRPTQSRFITIFLLLSMLVSTQANSQVSPNLALGKGTAQSTIRYSYLGPSLAVDGDTNGDSDSDGIPDAYEDQYGLGKLEPSDDLDNDGLSNLTEYRYGLAADDPDSDGDGLPDATEVRWFGVPEGDIPDSASKALILGTLEDNLFDSQGKSIFGHCEDDKLIMHVLNRLTFGPTPELYAQLKGDTDCGGASDSQIVHDNIFGNGSTTGWINEQLDTLGIPKEKERRNLTYKNGNSAVDFVSEEAVTGEAYQMVQTYPGGVIDLKQGNVRLLHPDDKAKQCTFDNDPVACICDLAYDRGQCVRDTAQPMNYGASAIADMEVIRPVISHQHIRTRLGKFWDNHFNTDIATGDQYANGTEDNRLEYQNYMNELYESDTFFMGAFGNFYQDLLLQSAMSPTMLRYLDTDGNTYDENDPDFQPNENYARELLELHTIGEQENIAYDHDDILALGRVFTGWSVTDLSRNELAADGLLKSRYRGFNASRLSGSLKFEENEAGYIQYWRTHNFNNLPDLNKLLTFQFNGDQHDLSEKELSLGDAGLTLGKTETGLDEGKAALKFIADLPNTAEFICIKLSKLLVSDDPNTATIDLCKSTYLQHADSDEQMKHVIKALVYSDQFMDPLTYRAKFKDRWEYLYSFLRVFDFDADWEKNSEVYSGDRSVSERGVVGNPIQYTGRLGTVSANTGGYVPFSYPSPDGEAEDAISWMSADQILKSSKVTTYLMDQQYKQNRRGLLPLAKLVNRLFDNNVPLDINPADNIPVFPSFTIQEQFVNHADKMIIGNLLNLVYGSDYQAADVIAAYNILNQTSNPFIVEDQAYIQEGNSIAFSRLRALVAMLANVYEFRIQ